MASSSNNNSSNRSNNNNHNHIPQPVSNVYNPNNLSLFPDLLEPINANEHQNLVPPLVPAMTDPARVPMICPPNYTMAIVQKRCYMRLFNNQGEYLGGEYADSTPWLIPIPEREIDAARILVEGNLSSRIVTEIERAQASARAQAAHQQNSSHSEDMGVEQTSVNHQSSGVLLQPEEPEADENNNPTCPICMAPFSESTAARCGHVFCKSCITQALQRRKQCPVCRKRLATKRDLFRIYLH